MSRQVAIGIAQITGAPYAPEANRELTVESARKLFDDGADIVILPELAVPGYAANAERLRELAEPVDGPTVKAWTQLAREKGGWIAGGLCERDGEHVYNTAVIVGEGGLALHYRKLHPFREEKDAFRPGDLGLPVAKLPFGTVGACICYDLRFIETLRALTLKGAELVCVPTAWLPGFDQERWDKEGWAPQARNALLQANLDQTFVACASQAGDNGDLDFLGSSLVADPYGKVRLGPLPGSEQELAIVSVDLDDVTAAHERQPLVRPRADRRTDVYGLAVDGEVL